MHTRAKKKLRLATHKSYSSKHQNNNKKTRPKTFKTKETADKYAKDKGILSYKLKKVKKNKKFQIIKNIEE